ncbi:MAG: carboxymuconolactone decarboxylase family protein [Actinobacteria bacterium]|nr:carboxymuconolactone decarboxylase family protein [Actinomycetota bacterium]
MQKLREEIPGVVGALEGLHGAVLEDGALSARTKSLILVGISTAIRCEPCIRRHVRTACELGATRSEIAEAAGAGVLMGGGPAAAYAGRYVMEELDAVFGQG